MEGHAMSNFKPIGPDDVTDLAGLPRRFDAHCAEYKQDVADVKHLLRRLLDRMDKHVDDDRERFEQLERAVTALAG